MIQYPGFKKPKTTSEENKLLTVAVKVPGAIYREKIWESMSTGYLCIDGLFPLGRGQRELIIGDKQTGKTALSLDTIINQKYQLTRVQAQNNWTKTLFCIYVGIGQKSAMLKRLSFRLIREKVKSYALVVATSAVDPAIFDSLPYTGCFGFY